MKFVGVVSGLILTTNFFVVSSSLNVSESENENETKNVTSYNFSRELFSLLPIFPTFTDRISNERCKNDSRVFREQLAEFRLWAVKMLDSSTKLPDGILAGNTFQLGHFDECLSVSVALPNEDRKLRGQYCLAEVEYSPKNLEVVAHRDDSDQIDLFNTSAWHHIKSFNLDRTKTRRDEIFWALCIPESCSPQDLKEAMDEALESSKDSLNVDITVKVHEKFCQVGKDGFDFSWIGPGQLVLGAIVALFAILVTVSTFYDLLPIPEEKRCKGRLADFLACFSAKVNFRNLRKVDASKDIVPIHTVRFMSMVVILMGHRFIANSGAPTHNAGFMEAAVENPLFIHLLMGPVLVVDTFFLLSGFLTGNQMLRDFDTRRFKLFSGYIHRYIRLTPVYILVVGFYATYLYQIGSGPLWKARVSLEQERCSSNWWTNLIYINNYVNTEHLCMFQSWHLTCDFHFYLMAPPIVYLLWKKAALGISLILTLIAVVSVTLFVLTFNNYLDPVLMSFNSVMVDLSADPTFRVTYIPTHTRFIPYLIGIIASYIYYKKKLHIKLTPTHQTWSTVIGVGVAHIPILSAILFYTSGYEYDRTQAAIYAAFHRIPWCMAMAWMILMAATGNSGLLQHILSWKALVPLSRLTYCVFLSHGAIQLYTSASLRTPDYNSQFKVFWTLMGDILVTYLVALVMYILFEAPILRLDRKYFTSSHKSNDNNTKPSIEVNGEINHGYSSESIQHVPVISNHDSMFAVTQAPHEKYSDRYDNYVRRKSETPSDSIVYEIR